MEHFLAERYLSGQDAASLALEAQRVHESAEQSGRARLLTTLYVPDDETCFYLLQGESVEAAGAAGTFDRVVRVDVAELS